MAVLSIQGDWRECGIGQEFSSGGASVALVGSGWGGSAKTVGYHPVRVIFFFFYFLTSKHTHTPQTPTRLFFFFFFFLTRPFFNTCQWPLTAAAVAKT